MAEGGERDTGAGGGDPRAEEPTVALPDWRDPPTGEIPRIIEELAGEPLPIWRVEDTGRFDVVSENAGIDDPDELRGETTVEIRPEGAPRPADEGADETWDVDADTLGRGVPSEDDETLFGQALSPRHRRRFTADRIASTQEPLDGPGHRGNSSRDGSSEEQVAPVQDDDLPRDDVDWPDALVAPREGRGRPEGSTRPVQSDTSGPREHPSRHDVVASRRRRRLEAEPETEGTPPAPSRGRSKLVSTLTGIVLGALVLAALARGPVTTLIVVAVALGVGAIEAYALLRRAGYAPMIGLGVLSVVAMPVLGYLGGQRAVLATLAGSTVVTLIWFVLLRGGRYLLRGFGPTQALVLWVGLFGSFASLMLRPAEFGPDGLGLLVGTLATAVAADVFAFFGGSLVGRRPLAPRISPSKTIEGVVIGGVAAVLVGALGVARIHPFDLESGLALGVLAAVVVPLGDLAESALKRLVDAKDSSRLLPGHGGMLDRIDGILLLLPCAYALFSLMHLA